jgi:hypothetical protein
LKRQAGAVEPAPLVRGRGPCYRDPVAFFFGDETPPEPVALCELILMVALADGQLEQEELDGLARALESGALGNLSWDFAMERAAALAEDAPLFFEARDQLALRLVDPLERKTGLALAARIAGARRPLDDAEQALLHSVAKTFALTDRELEQILSKNKKAGLADELAYVRSRFNDPTAKGESTLFDYLGETRDDAELRTLMYKISGVRRASTKLFENSEVISMGELRSLGSERLRIDAIVDAQEKRWLMRFLGPGEALWHHEHPLWQRLCDELMPAEAMLFFTAKAPAIADQALFKRLNPSRVAVHRLEL